jgi:hypothetical protein
MKKLLLVLLATVSFCLSAQDIVDVRNLRHSAFLAKISELAQTHRYQDLSAFVTSTKYIEEIIDQEDLELIIQQVKSHANAGDYLHVIGNSYISLCSLLLGFLGYIDHTKPKVKISYILILGSYGALCGHNAEQTLVKLWSIRSTVKVLEDLKKRLAI